MVSQEFYSKQYSAIMAAVDKAITYIEKGYPEEAKTLLEFTLLAAEDAYIEACGKEPNS